MTDLPAEMRKLARELYDICQLTAAEMRATETAKIAHSRVLNLDENRAKELLMAAIVILANDLNHRQASRN